MHSPIEPQTSPGWARWTLVAISVAAAWFRLPGLAAEEPWFDEAFSIVLASENLPDLLRHTLVDQTNPPGFYLLLWIWTRIGGFDLSWMRLLPALAGILTIPVVAFAARATGLSWGGGVVAAALAAGSPLLFAMSSELRAYASVALVSALLLGATVNRRPVAAAWLGIVLVMLHYFGALLVAAVALGSVWRDRRDFRTAVLTGLPAAFALTAWFILVLRAADEKRGIGGNASWITSAGSSRLLSLGDAILGNWGTTLGSIGVAAALSAALVLAVRHAILLQPSLEVGRTLRIPIVAAIGPLAMVVTLELLTGRALWLNRYLIIVLPAWFVLLAHAVTTWRGKSRGPVMTFLLTWSLFGGLYAEESRTKKTAWSRVARALTGGAPTVVCVSDFFVALPLRLQALQHGIPLTVLDLDECTPRNAPQAIIIRPGNEVVLNRLLSNGAVLGVPRDLGTFRPETQRIAIHWK